jgi:hypothetical protein
MDPEQDFVGKASLDQLPSQLITAGPTSLELRSACDHIARDVDR